jgi:hypothetical protein
LILIKASIGLLWFEVVECSGENHMPKLALIGAALVKLTDMRSKCRSLDV